MAHSTRCAKITTIVVNIILGLLGCSAVICSYINRSSESLEANIINYVTYTLIAVFSILGAYAVFRENQRLAVAFAGCLFLLIVIQTVMLLITLHEFGEPNGSVKYIDKIWLKDGMDTAQRRFECCGRISPQDYVLLNRKIPASCYEDQKEKPRFLYVEGCIDKLQSILENSKYYFLFFTWCLLIFEIICFICTVYHVVNYRNHKRRMQFCA